jgi:TPR repeat protein
MLESAQSGDASAQNELAIAYSEGLGIKPSQRKAVYWFRKSAEQGYSLGVCNLGLHYGRGAGVRRDRTMMMKWVFIANALDGLKCQPGDYVELFQPNECEVEKGFGNGRGMVESAS